MTVCLHHGSEMALACSSHRVLKSKPCPLSSTRSYEATCIAVNNTTLWLQDLLPSWLFEEQRWILHKLRWPGGFGPFDRPKDRRPFGYVKLLVDEVQPLLFCAVDL